MSMNINVENIVDIRRLSEWMEFGILKGSKLITFEDSSGKISPMFLLKIEKQFKKNDEIVLMCQTAKRSKKAMQFLKDYGYENVSEIRGGAFYLEKLGAKFEAYRA